MKPDVEKIKKEVWKWLKDDLIVAEIYKDFRVKRTVSLAVTKTLRILGQL